ncbi:MAG TPA: lipase family protein [Actinomycetota bacterium]|nr:lipase family protein [Actinomycetota bacterium]
MPKLHLPGTIGGMIGSASARGLLGRRLPTWALLVLGVGMAVVGALVATRPDLSITLLVVLVGGGFAAAGVAGLLSAGQERRPWPERSLGGALVLLGVVAVAWPGATVQVLARLIGIGLLLSGVGGPFADGAGAALARLVVEHGWVGVISDYVGLGTAGPHAYLVGQAAARDVLEATRAAGQLGQLRLDRRTVVWGHSQGGHGAIWAGIVGPGYAPELEIVGVAALAPATDLEQLATGVKNPTFGRVVSAYLAESWAAFYPQLDMDRLVDRCSRRTVSRLGQRCFSGDALAAAAVASQLFGPSSPTPPGRGPLPGCWAPTAPRSWWRRRCWSPRATPTRWCWRPCSAAGWPPAAPPASGSTPR